LEVDPFEKERLGSEFGKSIGEAVTEIEPCRVAPLAEVAISKPSVVPRAAVYPPEISSISRFSSRLNPALRSLTNLTYCFVEFGIVIKPVTVEQAHLARQAFHASSGRLINSCPYFAYHS